MKVKHFLVCTFSTVLLMACNHNKADQQEESVNSETVGKDESATEGNWETLFDGSSLDKWHDYDSTGMSWVIEDGALTTPGGKGDIVTHNAYGNFEMDFDWKISEGGNSGVLYLVKEEKGEPAYHSGPEYQLIDAKNWSKQHPQDGALDKAQTTGANYAIDPPTVEAAKPAGEWNHGKIIVNEGHVEHWLNGQKVVKYTLWTDDWKKKVSQTKFKEWPEYGMAKSGLIALQDHGDRVWFKNIKIKTL